MEELLIVTTGGTIDKIYFDDKSDYQIGDPQIGQILRDLGVQGVRLLTNNPLKGRDLEAFGVPVVERVPLTPSPTEHNRAYLRTKRDRMGHTIDNLEEQL